MMKSEDEQKTMPTTRGEMGAQKEKAKGGSCGGGSGGAGSGQYSASDGACHKNPKTPLYKLEIEENKLPENWWDKLPDFDPRVYDAIAMEQAEAAPAESATAVVSTSVAATDSTIPAPSAEAAEPIPSTQTSTATAAQPAQPKAAAMPKDDDWDLPAEFDSKNAFVPIEAE
jgi:hypothetical protein